MTLTHGMLVHPSLVLQEHPGTCQHCGQLAHGILLNIDQHRKWMQATREAGSWSIHDCRARRLEGAA